MQTQQRAYTRSTKAVKKRLLGVVTKCGWEKAYNDHILLVDLVKRTRLISESKNRGERLPDKIQETLTGTVDFGKETF